MLYMISRCYMLLCHVISSVLETCRVLNLHFLGSSKTLVDSASLCRTSDHQTTSNNTYHMALLEMVQRSEETKGYSKAISSHFLRQCDIM